MGLLDGVLGGAIGAEMTSVVSGFIQRHGGVQGIVTQMEQQGLGNTARSWVGTGTNLPITPEQLHTVFGSNAIEALAQKFGLPPGELSQKLSQLLPQVVDKMTPGGTVPPHAG